MSGGKGLDGLKCARCSEGIVAAIICSGSEGKAESSALPTITDRSGDHSSSAEIRGPDVDILSLKSCQLGYEQ